MAQFLFMARQAVEKLIQCEVYNNGSKED